MISQGPSEPTTFPDFWTWLPQSITFGSLGLSTTGWFVFMSVTYDESDMYKTSPKLLVHYLTPANEPMKFLLPGYLTKDKKLEDVSASDVIQLMKKVFSCQFREVPAAPITIPIERIPPHKREQLRNALRQRKSL